MAIIWSSGLETETSAFTTEWTDKYEGASNTITVSTTAAYVNSGSKGARVDIDYTDSANGARAQKTLTGHTEHWFRGYVKFDSNLEYGTAYATIAPFQARDGTLTLWYIYCRADLALNTFHWQVRVRQTSGSYTTLYQGTANSLTLGVWHYVEIHWKAGSGSDGGAEFKLNGSVMASNFTLDCSIYECDQLLAGAIYASLTFPENTGLAFDDVALDNAGYLGPVETDQEDWPDIYIDSGVAPGGDGSQADPYSSFSEINWSTGGVNSITDYYAGTPTASVTINLKKGGVYREVFTPSVSGTASYPIIVQAYGTGADPIVSGGEEISTWTDRSAASVLSGATAYWKANGYSGSGDLLDQIASYDATPGGTTSPLWLAHTGEDYVYFPGTSGNSFTLPNPLLNLGTVHSTITYIGDTTDTDTDSGATLTYGGTDSKYAGLKVKSIVLRETDASGKIIGIMDASLLRQPYTSHFDVEGNEWTMNRSSTLRKLTVVDRPCFLCTTAGQFTVADATALDLVDTVGQSMVAAVRIHGATPYSSYHDIIIKQTSHSTLGYVMHCMSSSTMRYRLVDSDATDRSHDYNTTAIEDGASIAVATVLSADRRRMRVYINGDKDESADYYATTIDDCSNALDLLLGRGDFVFYGAALFAATELTDAQVISAGLELMTQNVYSAAATTEPKVVMMDGTMLVKGADQYNLRDHEWYWASNVLYVADASGDPDTSGVTIEAAQRDYAITNSQAYIQLSNLHCQLSNNDLVLFNGADNCTISGGIYEMGWERGIYISGTNADGNLIDGAEVRYNAASGIEVNADPHSNDTVRRCNVHHNCWQDGTTDAWGWTAGIKEANGTSNNLYYENWIHHNGLPGMDSAHGVGLWLDVCEYAIGKFNLSTDNFGHGFVIERCEDSALMYNVSIRDAAAGGNAGGIALTASTPTDCLRCVLYGNTVYDCKNIGANIFPYPSIPFDNNLVRNNIVWESRKEAMRFTGGAINDADGTGNLYQCNDIGPEETAFIDWDGTPYSTVAAWEAAQSAASDNLSSDPKFVDPANDKLYLKSDSPCIDAARDVGTPYNIALLPSSSWPDAVVTGDQDDY